jgi:prepilin-type N-terminal cleavage/methylation domain-containing protein
LNRYVQRMRESEAGFTLIELMIVIVILAILAGIVLFAVGGVTDRGTVAACKTDLSTVSTGVEAYYAKHGSYPPNLDPTLTTAPDQFLRPQPSLTGNTQTGTGYVITYNPADGSVTSNLGSC